MLDAGMTTIESTANYVACRSFNAALSASMRGKPIETSPVDLIDVVRGVLSASREARRNTGKTFRSEPLLEILSVLNLDFRSGSTVQQ